MSHTNSTANYNLPQFVTSDKPAWLTDINNAFLAIDTGMDAAKDVADAAASDAGTALTNAASAQADATAADGKASGVIASISDAFDSTATYAVGDIVIYNSLLYVCSVAVVTPGAWTGSVNWTRTTVETLIDDLKDEINDNYTAGVGDTLSLRYKIFPGMVTNSKKRINFWVDSAKLIDTANVNSCTITGSSLRLYTYNTNEQISVNDGTWSFIVRSDGIQCQIDLTTAIDSDNAVNVYFSPATTLTFTA